MWMPLYIGDYLGDTLELSRKEHGSYLLLIMAYWRRGGPLPDDNETLMQIAKCPPDEWPRTREVMLRFFKLNDGLWIHKRIDEELENSKHQYAKRSSQTEGARTAKATKSVTDIVTEIVSTPVTERQPQPQSHIVKQPQPQLREFPSHLRTSRFLNKWASWMEVRRSMKKPKDWLALFNEQVEWISKYDETTALEILSSSIRNGWQGLFEPRNSVSQKQSESKYGSTFMPNGGKIPPHDGKNY